LEKTLQTQLAALGNKVMASKVPDGCKQTTAWCIGQLPALYSKFCQTSESRYGEEISRLVQGVLKELSAIEKTCPEALKLATGITDRLLLLHEQFGIPELNIKPVGPSLPRSRKAS
jgi:hypothetical protein